MTGGLERVARVGIAAWLDGSRPLGESAEILGLVGDELCLIEIDAENRARVVAELIAGYSADRQRLAEPLDEPGLRIDVVFFGDAGSCFASALDYLELWPKSAAEIPADVFVDSNYKASFTTAGDEVVVSVRHALRPIDQPPRRRFQLRANEYEQALTFLAQESRSLRDALLAAAQQAAPQKLASLREGFKRWPA